MRVLANCFSRRLWPVVGLLLVTTFTLSERVSAQSVDRSAAVEYVGGGIAGVFNSHTGSIPVYRGSTLCGEFTGGNSILPDAWLLFEKPMGATRSSLWIAPRLRISDMSATLSTRATDQARARDPLTDSLVATTRVFEYASSLLGIGADLFVRYPVSGALFLFGGPSASYLIRKDANLDERITEPSNAVFTPNGSGTRSLLVGSIPNANALQAFFSLGANADVPLSPKVLIAPEVSLSLPLTSIRSDASWHILRVALGVSLKFDVAPEPQLAVIPPPEKHKPTGEIAASVQLSGVIDSAGREIEIPNPQIRVEEIARRESYPLLNYIFFDSGSAAIPARYDRLTTPIDSFHFESLSSKSELEAYHEILNVVGKRMTELPQSKITLAGYSTDRNLAAKRAQAVKDYLVTTWKIDPARIATTSGTQPKNASSRDTKQGAEENERVEITSNDQAMLDPVTFETVDRSMNPPKLRIRTAITSKYPLDRYGLTLDQGNRELIAFNSAHAVQDWTPTAAQLPSTNEPLYITLNLRDSIGTSLVTRDSAHIEQLTIKRKREERVADKIIERYNLITFDFDKSNLDDRSQRIIQDIASQVATGVSSSSPTRIALTGYTDLVGESEHNQKLSSDRASAVKSALLAAIGPEKASNISIDARGEGATDLVDNRLPEGRFLSRTVQVRIERPVQ